MRSWVGYGVYIHFGYYSYGLYLRLALAFHVRCCTGCSHALATCYPCLTASPTCLIYHRYYNRIYIDACSSLRDHIHHRIKAMIDYLMYRC